MGCKNQNTLLKDTTRAAVLYRLLAVCVKLWEIKRWYDRFCLCTTLMSSYERHNDYSDMYPKYHITAWKRQEVKLGTKRNTLSLHFLFVFWQSSCASTIFPARGKRFLDFLFFTKNPHQVSFCVHRLKNIFLKFLKVQTIRSATWVLVGVSAITTLRWRCL